MKFFKRHRQTKLEKQVLDLQSVIDAKDRIINVLEAEIESMAAVIARDRARIKAEGAAYARQQAEAEGIANEHEHLEPGLRRYAS